MISYNILKIFKGGPRNIRHRLLRDIILLVLVTAILLVMLAFYFGGNIRRQASERLISTASLIVKKKVSTFIEPVNTYLSIGYLWGKDDLFGKLDPSELNRLFIPMLSAHTQISAVSIADEQGRDFFLKRDGDKWLVRHSYVENGQRTTRQQLLKDANHLLESQDGKIDFDPRMRPWFTRAAEKDPGRIYWTNPYIFFTAGKPGITASISWHDPKDDTLSVMALDILLDDLFTFLNQLEAGRKGHIILMAEDGSIIMHNRFNTQEIHRHDLPVKRALELWQHRKQDKMTTLEFNADGKTWWAGFTPLKTDQPSPWIAVVIPEDEIMQDVKRQWLKISMAGLFILFIAISLALALVKKYSYQLRDLPHQKIREDNLENRLLALIAAGESTGLEFKSTLRMNLKTGKKGKEIEIAWLKTLIAFMNSDGGILLIGVEDDGNILGIEADGFENMDKCRLHCKNLINNHIGPEFARFIHLEVCRINNKFIVVIECERVRKPVFLTVGKNEDFFVRSGPSSMKLTMSQMVKYLEERK